MPEKRKFPIYPKNIVLEEFLLWLHDCSIEDRLKCAEDMRIAIEERAFTYKGKTLRITASFSIGVTTAYDNRDSLFTHADVVMYQAKRCGRNRVKEYRPERQTYNHLFSGRFTQILAALILPKR